ncbi:hypothetical protein [[Eubacterium] cellulosolvens]
MLIDNKVTRLGDGVTNRDVADIFASLKTMDPTRYHTFFDDFDPYTTGTVYTLTEIGTGTDAGADGDGGLLLLTTGAVGGDNEVLNSIQESFLFETGKPLFFRGVLQTDDATLADVFFGLAIKTATDPVGTAPTDGVFFQKDNAAATIDFVVTKNSTPVTAAAIASMADATNVELAFYWDGIDRIWYSVDGTVTGYVTPGASLPDDEVLGVLIAVEASTAAARTLTVDYVMVAKER